jgi:hypothetical protein
MAVWTVWEHDKFDEDERAERAVFVRDGFSFLAFLVPPLWLLANGMILVLIAFVVAATAATMGVQALAGGQMAALVSLAISIWFGFEARGLRRWALARRGWRMSGVVEARDFREAERRYFTARLGGEGTGPTTAQREGAPASVPVTGGGVANGRDPAVLGVFPEGQR